LEKTNRNPHLFLFFLCLCFCVLLAPSFMILWCEKLSLFCVKGGSLCCSVLVFDAFPLSFRRREKAFTTIRCLVRVLLIRFNLGLLWNPKCETKHNAFLVLWVKCPHSQKKFAASLLKKASLLHTHTLCIIKYESVFLKCRNFRRRKRKKASTTVYKLSCDPGSTRYERKRLVSMRSLSLSLF
jgi:hypothetical protein